MKQKKLLFALIFALATLSASAQDLKTKDVVEALPHKVENLQLKDLRNKPTTLPYYGEKHLLIFYVDPDKHKQNDNFACEIEENKYCESDNIVGFGILNLKDTVFPNSIVKMIARKRTEKNNATIIADTDNTVEQQWGLGE